MQKINMPIDLINLGIKDAYNIFSHNKKLLKEIILHSYPFQKRLIFKPTRFYYSLLKNSSHPLLLIDTKKRIDYLQKCLSGYHNISKTIIHSEINDLLNLEIPYFYFKKGNLYNSKNVKIEQSFLFSSLDVVLKNIKNLSSFKNELTRQINS